MAVTKIRTVAQAEKEDRRQTLIIIFLSTLCLCGFTYVIYDYVQITNRISLPERLSEMDSVVKQLEADGLVVSFNVSQSKLFVSGENWSNLSHEEKVGLITQLARYCAEKNKSEMWTLTVLDYRSTLLLGELGMTGLTIN